MAMAMVLIDSPGPLGLSATFNFPGEGPVIFALSGTAFSQNGGNLIGFSLSLDGAVIGKPALCYANQGLLHAAMRTTFIPVDKLTYAQHTIEISPIPGTVTDFNDYFQVTLIY